MTTLRFIVAILISLWGILMADPALAQGRRGGRDRNRGESRGYDNYRGYDYRGGRDWGYNPGWSDYGRQYPGYSVGYINQGSSDPCAPHTDYAAIARDGGRAAGDGFPMTRSARGKLELGLLIAGTGFNAWTYKKCHENLRKEALAARDTNRRTVSFDESREERIVERVIYVERESDVDTDRRPTFREESSRVRRNTTSESSGERRMHTTPRTPDATRTIATNCTSVPVQLFRNNQLLELYPTSYGGRGDDNWLDPGETAWIEVPKGQSAIAVGPFGAVPAVADIGQLWVFEPEG